MESFQVIPFSYGFIIDFGDVDKGAKRPLIPPTRLSAAFEGNQRWLDRVDIEIVADVNALIRDGRTLKLINIAEALHEKQLSDIADTILQQRRALRVLLISGPSSSGKTSTTQRLSTQLEVNGFKPVSLSLDHYYVDRERTPLDAEGRYDFDTIDALDLPLLKEQLGELVEGRAVETPVFDFRSGRRADRSQTVQVGPDEILVIEGIHALNPALLAEVNRNLAFKVYVSALGGLNIDLMNRVPTTEIRLLRRIVRDDKYRGHVTGGNHRPVGQRAPRGVRQHLPVPGGRGRDVQLQHDLRAERDPPLRRGRSGQDPRHEPARGHPGPAAQSADLLRAAGRVADPVQLDPEGVHRRQHLLRPGVAPAVRVDLQDNLRVPRVRLARSAARLKSRDTVVNGQRVVEQERDS